MVQPTLKPTDSPQILERRHTDPPVLWFAVIVGSLLIHLLTFGIVRLLLMGGSQDLQPRKNVIPVDVITVPPKTTSPTQIAQKSGGVTTKNSTGVNPPTRRTSNPSQNRPTSSSSASSATRSAKSPTSRPIASQNKPSAKPIQKPTAKISPSQKDIKSPVANSSPKPDPVSPTNTPPKPSPAPSPSPKPSPAPSPSPKPSPAPSPSPKPSPAPSPSPKPSPAPSPSPKPSPSPTTETPRGGSISVGSLELISNTTDVLHPGDPNYKDRLATLLEGNRQLSAEELKQLGITLDKDLKLKVGVLVETNGTATVIPKTTTVLSGNISSDVAERLANKIIQQWKFQPTLQAGQPVLRDYYLPVTISPIKK